MYYIGTILLSSIQLTGSQFQQDVSSENDTNETDPACTNSLETRSCSELPAVCVDCDFFQDGLPQCSYNVNYNFSCWPMPGVVCEVCIQLLFPLWGVALNKFVVVFCPG